MTQGVCFGTSQLDPSAIQDVLRASFAGAGGSLEPGKGCRSHTDEPEAVLRGIAVTLMLLCLEGREKFQLPVGLANFPAQHLATGLSMLGNIPGLGQPHPQPMLRVSSSRGVPEEAFPGFLPSQDLALPSAIMLPGEPESLKSPSYPASLLLGAKICPQPLLFRAHHFLIACRGLRVLLALLVLSSLAAWSSSRRTQSPLQYLLVSHQWLGGFEARLSSWQDTVRDIHQPQQDNHTLLAAGSLC